MSSVVISGDTSGSITLAAPAVAGGNTITLPARTGTAITTADTATVTPTMLTQPLTLSTSQATTSGTFKDFTGIPSWVERITVMFNGVSLSGTSSLLIQLGDSGGVETTGYVSSSNSSATEVTSTAGFIIRTAVATNTVCGNMIIATLGSNVWSASFSGTSGAASVFGGGAKTLSDTITQLRITTVNGTDTFDAGSVNIMYE